MADEQEGKKSLGFFDSLKSIVRKKGERKLVALGIALGPAKGRAGLAAMRRKRKRERQKEIKRRLRLLVEETEGIFNKCGYRSDTQVTRPFYHSYREDWPINHVLSNGLSVATSVTLVLDEIKKMDVGVNLLYNYKHKCFNMLGDILRRLVERHIHAPYKYMAWHYALRGMKRKMNDDEAKFFKRGHPRDVRASTSCPHPGGVDPHSCVCFTEFANSSGKEHIKPSLERNNFDKAVPPEQIMQFLSTCVRHTVPIEFFGCAHNQRRFITRWLSVLVGVPGRKSVGLGHLMHRMRVSRVPWAAEASPIGGRGQRACIIAKAWLWLLLQYLAPILSCHFVLVRTSGEGLGGRPYAFFAKRVWQSLKHFTIRHHSEAALPSSTNRLDNKGWAITQISSDEMEKIVKPNGCPITSHLQLRPKRNGLRPVLRIRVSEKDELKFKACIVFTHYLASNSRKRCPTHKTMNDISQAWAKMYEMKSKARQMVENYEKLDEPVFYAVNLDVKDAFGCVLHDKLCEIIQKKLEMAKLTPETILILRTVKYCLKDRKGKVRYHFRDELLGFPLKQENAEKDDSSKGESKEYVSRMEPFQVGDLCELLNRCIKSQTLKDGKRFYLLSRGLAQGSPLSCYLWKLYCDALEDQHLIPHLSLGVDASKFSYLIRGTDDYLFLTEDHEEAEWFLRRMTEGFPDFNIQVNPSKNYTNLCSADAVNVTEAKVNNSIGFKFWGLVLDPINLSVMADYGGPPGRDLAHAFNLYVLKKPKRILEATFNLGRLKLAPILLNAKYNGYKGILINIYRAALIQAAYFHAAVTVILPSPNQVLLIQLLTRKAQALTHKVISVGESCCLPEIPVRSEIFWLAYRAYRTVLGHHGGRYPGVLRGLKWLEKYTSKKIKNENALILKEVSEMCKHLSMCMNLNQ